MIFRVLVAGEQPYSALGVKFEMVRFAEVVAMSGRRLSSALGFVTAGSLLLSSTMAVASPTPARMTQPDPLAIISVMSGGAPAAVLCGAAAAAATAAQPATGCVLPQVDVTAPVATAGPPPQPIPVPPVEGAGPAFGFSPALLGIAALAAGLGLYFALKGNHHNNEPVSA